MREILACSDELFSICSVFKENISQMEDMLRTAQVKDGREQNDATDVPETGNGESADDEEGDLRCDSATQRIQWALGLLNQNVKCFEALLTDLRLIADTVSMHFLLSSFIPHRTTPNQPRSSTLIIL